MLDDEHHNKRAYAVYKGPDFPTGGIVINKDELLNIYETGVGKIKMRGKVEVEKAKGGKKCCHYRNSLPDDWTEYCQVFIRCGSSFRNQEDHGHCRYFQPVLQGRHPHCHRAAEGCGRRELCKHALQEDRLEDTFGVNMLAIADGRPETMGLKQIFKANARISSLKWQQENTPRFWKRKKSGRKFRKDLSRRATSLT